MKKLSEEQEQALKGRLPKTCPFCSTKEDGDWDEFEIIVAQPFYSEGKYFYTSKHEPFVKITCTRCEEDIREEDVQQ